MYRSDRYSRIEGPDRTPIFITVTAVAILAVAISCVAHKDRKVEKTASSTPAAVAPPAVVTGPAAGGEVADSNASTPRIVTFAAAESAYRTRDYAAAADGFDGYVQRHPDNAFGHYMLGLSAWKSGELDRARDALERSLALDSTNVKTLLNLGRVLLDQGHPDEAQLRVALAAALDSESAEVHRMMARVQYALGQRDSAETEYRVALSIDPTDSWSMNNLGLLLIDEGRYDEAIEPLARAVQLRPQAPAFANNLGVALERTGHAGSAAEAYRAALSADSTYAKARTSLARVDRKVDDTPIDVTAVAAKFEESLQSAKEVRLMAKAPVPVPEPTPVKPEP